MRTPRKVWRCCSFPVKCRATFTTSSLRKNTVPTKPSTNSFFVISENLSALSSSREPGNQLFHHDNAPTRGTNSFLVSKEVPRNLWKPKVRYRVHKSPQLVYSKLQSRSKPETVQYSLMYLLASIPTAKLEDHPLSLIHNRLFNLFCFPPYFGAVSSIRNLRKRSDIVTRTHFPCHIQ